MKSLFIALFFFPILAFGQENRVDFFSLQFGYGSTNMRISEAVANPSGYLSFFSDSKVYTGDGIQFGFAKDLNKRLFLDVSLALFSGAEQTYFSTGNLSSIQRTYALKGTRIPVSINYLFRDPSKRFQINLGAGLQYLHFKFQQFETQTTSGLAATKTITDLNAGQVQLLLNPGVQLRLFDELRATFNINMAVISRYNDSGSISLKYTFKNKNID